MTNNQKNNSNNNNKWPRRLPLCFAMPRGVVDDSKIEAKPADEEK